MNKHYPNANLATLSSTVEAYVTSVDELYGHYLDSTMGFAANHKTMVDGQQKTKALVPPGTDLDGGNLFFGHGSPNNPSNRLLHKTTQGEFKRRNQKGGRNYVRAAQLLIVLLYSFWEHEYRPRLAASLGLNDATELKVPLLGDIRLLRCDVIHHRGVVTKETITKLSILTGFREGMEIIFDGVAVETLVRNIKAAMDELVLMVTGSDPMHRKVWRIQ